MNLLRLIIIVCSSSDIPAKSKDQKQQWKKERNTKFSDYAVYFFVCCRMSENAWTHMQRIASRTHPTGVKHEASEREPEIKFFLLISS